MSVLLVSEAPRGDASNSELLRCLYEAGLATLDSNNRIVSSCRHATIFPEAPPSNDIQKWCVGKAALPKSYDFPPVARGKYLNPIRLQQVQSFLSELSSHSANVIVALGNTPLWALTGLTGIANYRGALALTPYGKVLPTYHPGYIFQSWSDRPVLIADLVKARLHSNSKDYSRPQRHILIRPTLEEIYNFEETYLKRADLISVDVETKHGQITCISFACSSDRSIVIPFWDSSRPDGNYWPSAHHEFLAKSVVRRVLNSPIPKLFQNGMYDIQYCLRERMPVNRPEHDTLILQHAAFPELKKSLGFLGSIHTDEPAWKLMRKEKADTVKRDE